MPPPAGVRRTGMQDDPLTRNFPAAVTRLTISELPERSAAKLPISLILPCHHETCVVYPGDLREVARRERGAVGCRECV